MMDILEKPLLAYLRDLMKQAGYEIDQEGAENMLGNIGTRRMLKNLKRPQ